MADDGLASLIAGFRAFRAGAAQRGEAHEPAAPVALVVAGLDLPVDPAALTGAAPRRLCVLRSPAALVPPAAAESGGGALGAALEQAVLGLGVRHAIVLGHGGCGLVRALLADGGPLARMIGDGTHLGPHLAHAAPALRRAMRPAIPDEARARVAAQELVRTSLENLLGYGAIGARVADGRLALHGWYFEATGPQLARLDPARDDFVAV